MPQLWSRLRAMLIKHVLINWPLVPTPLIDRWSKHQAKRSSWVALASLFVHLPKFATQSGGLITITLDVHISPKNVSEIFKVVRTMVLFILEPEPGGSRNDLVHSSPQLFIEPDRIHIVIKAHTAETFSGVWIGPNIKELMSWSRTIPIQSAPT